MKTKLTGEILLQHGFKVVGADILDRPIYRIKPERYHFHIEVILSPNYPADNPNVGILSVHSPEIMASAIPRDLSKKEDWTKEDIIRARDYKVKISESTQSIAWFLIDLERLKAIYSSLTESELVKIV